MKELFISQNMDLWKNSLATGSCCWLSLGNGCWEWRPLGMAAPGNSGPESCYLTEQCHFTEYYFCYPMHSHSQCGQLFATNAINAQLAFCFFIVSLVLLLLALLRQLSIFFSSSCVPYIYSVGFSAVLCFCPCSEFASDELRCRVMAVQQQVLHNSGFENICSLLSVDFFCSLLLLPLP